MADRLLTSRELQDYLHLDRITIYRMLQSGEIPAMKVGGQWRFSQADIDEWLKSHRGKGGIVPAPPQVQPLPPAEALSIATRPLASLRVCDLVAPSCLEIIQGSFAQALNVVVGITDLAGAPLVPFSSCCAFCQYGWTSPAFWQRCQASWSALSAIEEAEPQVHVCHAGIKYAVAPVQVNGQRLGLVVTGQFLPGAPDITFRRRIRQVSTECGLDEDRLLAEIGSIRIMDQEHIQLVTRLLVTIASALSEIAAQNFLVRQKLAQAAQILRSV
jgi:excisionase family DNA binding protein